MRINMTRGAIAIALLYAARRFYRNWGTTKEECHIHIPGDDAIGEPADVTTEGIWIDAPPSAVWPWLVQMGQDRAGFYASPGYQNTDSIHPEWQHLAVGDTVRLTPGDDGFVLSVVEVLEQQAIVLRTNRTGNWDATCTLHLVPHWQDRCRLLVRTRIRLAHPGAVVITELVGAPRALAVRHILKGIKQRAEFAYQAEVASAPSEAPTAVMAAPHLDR
ncbi:MULTISPECIES: SRPBCC family protein [unclassified Mycolicibacterium]|uniref:SRPBCC family protein n=1 Tax=unclassified Mycolicibacterium TaxID=2636767 RepID=UPI002EDA1F75